MSPAERHARKQVLLARIAFSRSELRRDVEHLKRAAELPHLLRGVVGNGISGTVGRVLAGAGGRNPAEWFTLAMGWLRRYRMATSLLASVAPMVRGRGLLRGALRVAVLGVAGALGWRAMRARRRSSTEPR